jgi:hypothetical protein
MPQITNRTIYHAFPVDLHSIIRAVGDAVSVIRADTSTVTVKSDSTQDLFHGYTTVLCTKTSPNSCVPDVLIELYSLRS